MMDTVVVNKKNDDYDIYIGRGSKWGNPFTHRPIEDTKAQFQSPTREASINAYRGHLMSQPELLECLPELKGKRLGCFCKPKPCHGDVLVELIENL